MQEERSVKGEACLMSERNEKRGNLKGGKESEAKKESERKWGK